MTLEVDDAEVATGVGALHWTGRLPDGVHRLRVESGDGVTEGEVRARLRVEWVTPPERDTAHAGPVRVPVEARIDPQCPARALTWRVSVDGVTAVTAPATGGRQWLELVLPEGRWTVERALLLADGVVASSRHALAVGPACAIDRDRDGACAAEDCDDADPDQSPGGPLTCADADRDGSPDVLDCLPRLGTVFPGAPEVDDGLDDDCDGVIPGSERRTASASTDDLRLAVRDGGQWRTSAAADDYWWGCERVVEFPGPGGARAWACTSTECDLAWGGATCRVGGSAWVLLPTGERSLQVVSKISVPGQLFRTIHKPEGRMEQDDRLEYPEPTSTGLRLGPVDWRWFGAELRPAPASPDAELAVARVSADARWFEVENCGSAPVDLAGLGVRRMDRWSGVRPVGGAGGVAPGARAGIHLASDASVDARAVVDDGDPDASVDGVLWAGARPLARIVPGSDDPDPCRTAAEVASGAVEVVRAYYAALEARAYRDAYARWEPGANPRAFDAFAAGFADTAHTAVEVGTPGPLSDGVVTVPVEVRATLRTGQAQRFVGWYAVRAVDGEWWLHDARLAPAR